MSEGPDDIVPMYLRRIDEKVDRLIDEVRDVILRGTSPEQNQAGPQRRMDRFEMRLDRVRRRLDLVEAH